MNIACDNQTVVSVLTPGRTRDRTLAAIARNIQMIVASNNVDRKVHHIMGKNNKIADLLSRWHLTTNPQHKLTTLIGEL